MSVSKTQQSRLAVGHSALLPHVGKCTVIKMQMFNHTWAGLTWSTGMNQSVFVKVD